MVEIVSVDPENDNLVKNALRSYQRLDRFYRMAILSMMLFVIATPLITSSVFETRQRAGGTQSTPAYIVGPTMTPTPTPAK